MRHVVILAIVLVAAPAVAGNLRELEDIDRIKIGPILGLGGGDRAIDRATIEVRVHRSDVVVDLTLELTGPDDEPRRGVVYLDLPEAATATGLTLTTGTTTMHGRAVAADEATADYERLTSPREVMRDPALLEHSGARDRNELRLRVAPLTTAPSMVTVRIRVLRDDTAGALAIRVGAPVKISVTSDGDAAETISLGGRARNQIAEPAGGIRAIARRGKRPITIAYGAVTGASWLTDTAVLEPAVTSSISLIAQPEPRVDTRPIIEIANVGANGGHRPQVKRELTARYFRRTIRLYLPRVNHCYEQALQRDWYTEGTITAVFGVDPDGSVGDFRLDTELDNATLRECVTTAFAGIEFEPYNDAGRVEVRYPINLVVGEHTRRARIAAAETEPLEPLPPLE